MLGKLLLVVANIPMDPEGAAGSMLFHEPSRSEASPHDNVLIKNNLIYYIISRVFVSIFDIIVFHSFFQTFFNN